MRMDLNADIGELPDRSLDAALMRVVTSVSIAAGVHAGNADSIRTSLRLARSLNVAAGVHPALQDRAGFGRTEMNVDPADVHRLVLDQIARVASIAAEEGIPLAHVKPHGALYNMAARDAHLAASVADAVAASDGRLAVFAPPDSMLAAAARAKRLVVVAEGFADRAYASDGSLVPRTMPGAIVTEHAQVVERSRRMALERTVVAIDGSVRPLSVDTICVHSDTADAVGLARAVRQGLEAAGVEVRGFTGS